MEATGTTWRQRLREIFDGAFQHDWDGHVQALNERFGFDGDKKLCPTAAGMPPVWFNGNIERVNAGRWVLVVSLNPSLARPGHADHVETQEAWWNYWLEFNRHSWYGVFFRPLVRVAATALGEPIAEAAYPDFATDRMIFVELCPYASAQFAMAPDVVARLVKEDRGFQIAEEVTRILLRDARPALILVNGRAAMDNFEVVHARSTRWRKVDYLSPDSPSKKLWHREGHYESDTRRAPLIGFPFLRKAQTHNSDNEIDELGRRLRAFLGAVHAAPPTPPLRPARQEPMPLSGRTNPTKEREFRRHDVTILGRTRTGLPLNRAMLEVVRAAVANGIHPRGLQLMAGQSSANNRWTIIPGRVGPVEARRAVRPPSRWFLAATELLYVGNETWVLSNQWSWDAPAGSSVACLEFIQRSFPQLALSWRRY